MKLGREATTETRSQSDHISRSRSDRRKPQVMKNIYFLSDAHLGSLAIPHARMQERRLVNFLDSVKHKAAAVYLNTNSRTEIRKAEPAPKKNKKTPNKKARSEKREVRCHHKR